MKLLTFIRLLHKKIFSRKESDYASFVLAQKLAALWYWTKGDLKVGEEIVHIPTGQGFIIRDGGS